MSISLEKGQKIDLTKDNPNLLRIRIGTSWNPAGQKPKDPYVKETPKKKGFIHTLGKVLSGEARIGDALNVAVDKTKETVNNFMSSDDINNDNYANYNSYSGSNIDIDTSVAMLQNDKLISDYDLIYYGHRTHDSGSINHMGDNTTGENVLGQEDDETIIVDLSKIPKNFNRLAIISNIYSCESRKQHFGMIGDAYVRIIDDKTNKELCRFNLTENYSGYTAMFVAEIYRYNDQWKFNAQGIPSKDKGLSDMKRAFR